MDKAPDFGSGDFEFESRRGRKYFARNLHNNLIKHFEGIEILLINTIPVSFD